jgi:hypothetical protein
VSRKQIVVLLFFEDTVTAENYPNLLTRFIAVLEKNERNHWIQQDGMTAHTLKTTAFLQVFWRSRIVGRGFWPP